MWQQLELAFELEFDLRDTVDWGRKQLVDFSARKTQLVSLDRSNNTGAIDAKMDGSVLGLTFFSKLGRRFYIISNVTAASKEIGALIPSMKFLSSEVPLYL